MDGALVLDAGTDRARVIVRDIAPAVVVKDHKQGGVVVSGFQGPRGINGTGTAYTFSQPSAATTWTINHNLGYRPQCTVLDTGNSVVIADTQHPSLNQTVITFASPMAGSARLQ